jgi:hypothetical protein
MGPDDRPGTYFGVALCPVESPAAAPASETPSRLRYMDGAGGPPDEVAFPGLSDYMLG